MNLKAGEPKPRRAAPSTDVANELDPPHSPARRAAKPRRFRFGRITLAAALIGICGTTIAGAVNLGCSAQPTTVKNAVIVQPFNRAETTSRSAQRPSLNNTFLAEAVTDRQLTLAEVEKAVAANTAAKTALTRNKELDGTSKQITKAAKDMDAEKNRLTFPAEGRPGSPWGMRLHPILGYYRMHWGTDIGAACGSPLRAVYGGVVLESTFNSAAGNFVLIDHGNFRGKKLQSRSLHMTRSIVNPGQKVKKGQVIGYTGSTGLSTECHLHFSTIWGGQNVDPVPLLNAK